MPSNISENKKFGKDISKLVGGTVIAQIVALCLLPIITRLFGPDIYGTANVFISIINILLVICCLKYDQTIILPENDSDAAALFFLCSIILIGVSIICFVLFWIFGGYIATLLMVPSLSSYLPFISIFLLVDGFYLIFRYWNTRQKRFGTQATTQIIQTTTGNGLKLGFGLCNFLNVGALLIGQFIGNLAALLMLIIQAFRHNKEGLLGGLSKKRIRYLACKYKKFPLVETWSDLIQNLSLQLPILMLTTFYSPTIVGFYSLGYMVLQAPLSLIGGSISQVYYQRASIAVRSQNLATLVEDVVTVMFLLTVIPLCMLVVLGGNIFEIVFGLEWVEAGIYVQILALWAIIFYVTQPLSLTFALVNRLEDRVKANILNLIMTLLAFGIGGFYQNIYFTLILFALFGSFATGYRLWLIFSLSHVSLTKIYSQSKFTIILALAAFFSLSFLKYILNLNIFFILGISGIIIFGYYAYLCHSNSLFKSYLPFKY